MAEEQQQTRQPLVDRTNKPDYIIPPKIIIDRNFYPAYGSEVNYFQIIYVIELVTY